MKVNRMVHSVPANKKFYTTVSFSCNWFRTEFISDVKRGRLLLNSGAPVHFRNWLICVGISDGRPNVHTVSLEQQETINSYVEMF